MKFFVLAFIFIFVFMQEKKELEFLISAMILVSVVISLRAIYQYFFGLPYIMQNFTKEQITKNGFYAWELLKQRRVISWFTAPNLLASYLIMFCPLVCGYIFKNFSKRNYKKVFLFSSILFINFTALMFTQAIGAFLSLFIGVIFFLIILAKNKIIFFEKKMFIVLFILFILFGSIFAKRSDYFFNFKNPENSFTQRINYLKSSIEIIKENNWVGIGAGNFGIVYPRFKFQNANETNYPHNSYLQIWVESGVFALIVFVFFVIYVFRMIMQEKNDYLTSGLLAGCLAFLLHNFVDYSFFIPQVSFVWWVLAAQAMNSNIAKTAKIKRREGGALKAIYCLLLAGLSFNLFLGYKSEVYLEKGRRLLKAKEFEQTISAINRALDFVPQNDFAYYCLAKVYQEKDEGKFSNLVIDKYKRAIFLNPKYAFYYYELAEYYKKYNDKKKAKMFFQQALYYYPSHKKFISSFQEISAS